MEIFKARGWQLIWTPPYCSYWCWIELQWLAGKSFVAAPPQQEENRRLARVQELLQKKWYGKGEWGVDGEAGEGNRYTTDVTKHIKKVNEYMDEWIKLDDVLMGTTTDPENPIRMHGADGVAIPVSDAVLADWVVKAKMKSSDEAAALDIANAMGGNGEDADELPEGDEEDSDEEWEGGAAL